MAEVTGREQRCPVHYCGRLLDEGEDCDHRHPLRPAGRAQAYCYHCGQRLSHPDESHADHEGREQTPDDEHGGRHGIDCAQCWGPNAPRPGREQAPPLRRVAGLLVKVLDPITGWCLRTEARLERYAEDRR